MQIQLKQREIEQALKQYIIDQGISLRGKNITIGFTAGRKDGGLTADINIDEADALPELVGDGENDAQGNLAFTSGELAVSDDKITVTEASTTVVSNDDAPAVAANVVAAAAERPVATSLFN